MTKRRLLDAVRTEREVLLAILDGIDTIRLDTIPVCGTWTGKDILVHLAAVDGAILEVVGQARRGEVMLWPWSGYANGNDWNETMIDRRRDCTVDDARAELESSTARLLEELKSWPDEAGPFGPDSWDEAKSPIGWLPAHDREHGEAISSLLIDPEPTLPLSLD